MADLQWPEGLPGPQISTYAKQEAAGYTDAQLSTGPAFVVPLTEDTPQFHTLTFQFKRGDARRFEQFLRVNKVKFLSPWFDLALPLPDNTSKVQECRFTQEGYPQLTGTSIGGLYTYSAMVMTRSIVTGDEGYETEIDAVWGTNCADINLGSSLLDEAFDIYAN